MPAVEIRPVRPHEHAAVADLTASVYLAEGLGDTAYEPALRDVASRAAEATALVAVRDGRVLGAVTVSTRPGPWTNVAVDGEAEIRMLVVDPAARGLGLGEALVRACLDAAREDGCAVVRLSTQDESVAAHRIYARLGFTPVPAMDWTPVPGVLLRVWALPLVPWCSHCGDALTPGGHDRCRRTAALDPPRYCAHCRRRMVVQVTPSGWTARCSEHGTRSG